MFFKVETLSCVTVIASDKTGTLTQNKMYVTNASIGLKNINSLKTIPALGDINSDLKIKSTLQLLTISILCNEAKFDETDKKTTLDERKMTGGATDCAILKYAASHIEIDKVNEGFIIISQVPFNSKNKWMATIFRKNQDDIEKEHLNCFGIDNNECVISIKGYILQLNCI